MEKKPTKLKKNRKKLWTIIGAAALVLIIGLIGLVNLMMPDKVEIPDVSNMEVEEATEILKRQDLSSVKSVKRIPMKLKKG